MAEQEQNKSEQASKFKLDQAKKKGSAAKSPDINSFVILSVLVVALSFWGQSMLQGQLQLGRYVLSNAGSVSFTPVQLAHWMGDLVYHALAQCFPLFLVLVLAAVLSNVLQTGPIFSTHPLKPDFDKINPAQGFKRLFSMKILVEAIKSLFKAAGIGLALYWFIKAALPTLFGLGQSDYRSFPVTTLAEIISLIKWCLVALLPLALLDLIYVRWDFLKKMMMSRREVTEEYKQREGDPRIRAKIRELQQEARKRSKSLRSVKEADVLITNPTRLAIAIRYRKDDMVAPMVIAKGAGQLAKLMREMAFRHQIPIVENKKLAATLFKFTAIDSQIPEQFYPAVARLLTWVYAKRSFNRGATAGIA